MLRNTSSRVIQNLQESCDKAVGVAYYYVYQSRDLDTWPVIDSVVSTLMAQLALQARCAPSLSALESLLPGRSPANTSLDIQYRQLREHRLRALFTILSLFRRTYIILDGLDSSQFSLSPAGGGNDSANAKKISTIIQPLLEQDFGNVSIAGFFRAEEFYGHMFDLADVSIRLLKAEPSTNALRRYCRDRVESKVKPELVTAGFRQPEDWLDDIEEAICNASDGLLVPRLIHTHPELVLSYAADILP